MRSWLAALRRCSSRSALHAARCTAGPLLRTHNHSLISESPPHLHLCCGFPLPRHRGKLAAVSLCFPADAFTAEGTAQPVDCPWPTEAACNGALQVPRGTQVWGQGACEARGRHGAHDKHGVASALHCRASSAAFLPVAQLCCEHAVNPFPPLFSGSGCRLCSIRAAVTRRPQGACSRGASIQPCCPCARPCAGEAGSSCPRPCHRTGASSIEPCSFAGHCSRVCNSRPGSTAAGGPGGNRRWQQRWWRRRRRQLSAAERLCLKCHRQLFRGQRQRH